MSPSLIWVLLAIIGLSHGYSFSSVPYYNQGFVQSQAQPTFYQQRALPYFPPNDINRPIIYPQMGMSPDYHKLVYKYITEFAGNEQPPHAKVDDHSPLKPEKVEEFQSTANDKEETNAEMGKPALNGYFIPSDFTLLKKQEHNQFYGNFNGIKTKKMNLNEKLTNPPIGGVMSDYILLRSRPDYQNYIPFPDSSEGQVSKRQISTEPDDTVVINAENPHSLKMNEGEESGDQQEDGNENSGEEEDQPGIAQSKPAAIALAGPGGVAQASPVGTALAGPGGLAVAAPSGTAVAGPAGQAALVPSADDKAKIVHKKIKEVWN